MKKMNEERIQVDYIVVEGIQARFERTLKRMIIALIISLGVLFFTNLSWLYVWLQYDYSSTETKTITLDGGEGTANFIGNDGDIVNGENSSQNG